MRTAMGMATCLMVLVGVGCVGDDAVETGESERELLIDGQPPPQPWTRVSNDPEVKATYMVAAGDLQELVGNNVIIGYIDLYTDIYSFNTNSGKMAVLNFWQRTRGYYPESTCTGSSPYDHTGVEVEATCPPVPVGSHRHWTSCPVHVMKGWGGAPPNRLYGIWSASATEVHFSWNVGGVKKKDYWFVRKKLSRIHYLELDGTRSNGPDSYYPSERTHGFAVGSNRQFNTSFALTAAMSAYNSHNFHKREYVWDDGQVSVSTGTGLTYTQCDASDHVWWAFTCNEQWCAPKPGEDDTRHPHTQQCINAGGWEGKFSENLSYWVDPFPAVADRRNAFWQWNACHVPVGSCYHGGSHAYPMLQVLDDVGGFYGWVGIEHQRDNPANPGEDDLRVTRHLHADLLP